MAASTTARALAVLLDRRAGHSSVGAENAAITRLGLKADSATLAVIEELAGVRRHDLGRQIVTGGAS